MGSSIALPASRGIDVQPQARLRRDACDALDRVERRRAGRARGRDDGARLAPRREIRGDCRSELTDVHGVRVVRPDAAHVVAPEPASSAALSTEL
jgi:hypothetical protein